MIRAKFITALTKSKYKGCFTFHLRHSLDGKVNVNVNRCTGTSWPLTIGSMIRQIYSILLQNCKYFPFSELKSESVKNHFQIYNIKANSKLTVLSQSSVKFRRLISQRLYKWHIRTTAKWIVAKTTHAVWERGMDPAAVYGGPRRVNLTRRVHFCAQSNSGSAHLLNLRNGPFLIDVNNYNDSFFYYRHLNSISSSCFDRLTCHLWVMIVFKKVNQHRPSDFIVL